VRWSGWSNGLRLTGACHSGSGLASRTSVCICAISAVISAGSALAPCAASLLSSARVLLLSGLSVI
jgi:hypothetical protein